MSLLSVFHHGHAILLETDRSLSFGRQADLVIADAQDVASIVGLLTFAGGYWWLRNESGTHVIDVVDAGSDSRIRAAPGAEVILAFERSTVEVNVGSRTYRFRAEVELPAGAAVEGRARPILNPEQRLLLVALAEPRLRGDVASVPTNGALAERLDWSRSKLVRKLDNLAIKLERAGVEGLRGDRSEMALDRRERMVDYAISSGLVAADDLPRLDETSRRSISSAGDFTRSNADCGPSG